jgi:RNA-dependent RNA polymerase
LRCNPDWQAAEVLRPRDTDFYRSERALGYLYRAISLQDLPTEVENRPSIPLGDPISIALKAKLEPFFQIDTDINAIPQLVTSMFQRYTNELRCISATHTISNTPGARLIEEELVIGTILAKCSQHRLRNDRIQRVLYHTEAHVRNFQRQIRPMGKEPSREDEIIGLERAWFAWALGRHRQDEFGAESFALVALRTIFELLEILLRQAS